MPVITRSDTTKGYGQAYRAPRSLAVTAPPRASFLGVPPEIRIKVYQVLFSGMCLRVWHYWRSMYRMHMSCYANAIVATCRQVNTEAWPIFLASTEVEFVYDPHMGALSQIHPKVQTFVLPYIRQLSFTHDDFMQEWLAIHELIRRTPCLEKLDIGTMLKRSVTSKALIYDAAINGTRQWPPEHKITCVCSSDRLLIHAVMKSCRLLRETESTDGSKTWLQELVCDPGRKYSIIATISHNLRENKGASLTVVSSRKMI